MPREEPQASGYFLAALLSHPGNNPRFGDVAQRPLVRHPKGKPQPSGTTNADNSCQPLLTIVAIKRAYRKVGGSGARPSYAWITRHSERGPLRSRPDGLVTINALASGDPLST